MTLKGTNVIRVLVCVQTNDRGIGRAVKQTRKTHLTCWNVGFVDGLSNTHQRASIKSLDLSHGTDDVCIEEYNDLTIGRMVVEIEGKAQDGVRHSVFI